MKFIVIEDELDILYQSSLKIFEMKITYGKIYNRSILEVKHSKFKYFRIYSGRYFYQKYSIDKQEVVINFFFR